MIKIVRSRGTLYGDFKLNTDCVDAYSGSSVDPRGVHCNNFFVTRNSECPDCERFLAHPFRRMPCNIQRPSVAHLIELPSQP